jgi:hypothetical protein
MNKTVTPEWLAPLREDDEWTVIQALKVAELSCLDVARTAGPNTRAAFEQAAAKYRECHDRLTAD